MLVAAANNLKARPDAAEAFTEPRMHLSGCGLHAGRMGGRRSTLWGRSWKAHPAHADALPRLALCNHLEFSTHHLPAHPPAGSILAGPLPPMTYFSSLQTTTTQMCGAHPSTVEVWEGVDAEILAEPPPPGRLLRPRPLDMPVYSTEDGVVSCVVSVRGSCFSCVACCWWAVPRALL